MKLARNFPITAALSLLAGGSLLSACNVSRLAAIDLQSPTQSGVPSGSLDLAVSSLRRQSPYDTQTIPSSTNYVMVTATSLGASSSIVRHRIDLQRGSLATASLVVPAGWVNVEADTYTLGGNLTASGSARVQVIRDAHTPCDIGLNPAFVPAVTGYYSSAPVAPGGVVTLYGSYLQRDWAATPSISISGVPAVVTRVASSSVDLRMPSAPKPWSLALSVDGVPMIGSFFIGNVNGVNISSTLIDLNSPPETGTPDSGFVTSTNLTAQVSMAAGNDLGLTWRSSSSAVGVSPDASGRNVKVYTTPGAPGGTYYVYATSIDDPSVTATCSVVVTTYGDAQVTVN